MISEIKRSREGDLMIKLVEQNIFLEPFRGASSKEVMLWTTMESA